jgi:hypothetical protein
VDLARGLDNLNSFQRSLNLRYFFHNKKTQVPTPPNSNPLHGFKLPSTWTPPPLLLPPQIEEVVADLKKLFGELGPCKPPPNINNHEKRALKQLRENPSIVIKPADKGSKVVILNKEDYINEGLAQLQDKTFYQPISSSISEDTATRVTVLLKEMLKQKIISRDNFLFLVPKPNPRPRLFYLLPKIHKDPASWRIPFKSPKGRPIVSGIDSVTYPVSLLVTKVLEPFSTTHPSYLKDTGDFLEKLRNIKIKRSSLLVTMDVESLYTNIDNSFGMQCVARALDRDPHPLHPFILKILKLLLETNDFLFNGQYYLQKNGTPMGATFSVAYANIVMAEVETSALNSCYLKPLHYVRFIDDIFTIWDHGSRTLDLLVSSINSQCPSIKVTSEFSSSSVNFLDLTILNKDGSLEYKPYFKETDSHQLLHKFSFHPSHTFKGIIKSQVMRLYRNSSNLSFFQQAVNIVFKALRSRGYSRYFLRQIKRDTLAQIAPRPPRDITGNQPCNSDRCLVCAHMISCSSFLYNGHKHFLQGSHNCSSSFVVYALVCVRCGLMYVGQSVNFRNRFNVHKSHVTRGDPSSSIGQHFSSSPHDLRDLKAIILEQVFPRTPETLDERERHWIRKLSSDSIGLNLNSGPPPPTVLPLVLPHCSPSHSIPVKDRLHIIKDTLGGFTAFHNTRFLTAFRRHKRLKDVLCSSKL